MLLNHLARFKVNCEDRAFPACADGVFLELGLRFQLVFVDRKVARLLPLNAPIGGEEFAGRVSPAEE